jgi:geranylgeranyl pyrophosphate synthase
MAALIETGSADALLEEWRRSIEQSLERSLPAEQAPPQRLHAAMRYAVLSGGKRLRPLIVLASAHCAGGPVEPALPGACAVELVHAFSLVHDDLPALDNDDLRRGRPTLHRAFDEALAILAGDALLTRAFDLLASGTGEERRRLGAIAALARAAGTDGMIGGQVDDLSAAARPPDAALVESIHRRKTAALMGAAAEIGALLAGAGEEEVRGLGALGAKLGLAFQIVDDLLDLEGTEELVGKTLRKDAGAGKATFPAVHGAESARRRAHQLVEEVRGSLAPRGEPGAPLERIARHVVERRR